jgi:hypothetical protein
MGEQKQMIWKQMTNTSKPVENTRTQCEHD